MSLQDRPNILDDLEIQSAEKKVKLKTPLFFSIFGIIFILIPVVIMQVFTPGQFAEFAGLSDRNQAEYLVIGTLAISILLLLTGIILLIIALIRNGRQNRNKLI